MQGTHPLAEDDQQQIAKLCADAQTRTTSIAEERRLLHQLVQATRHTRPYAARQYRALSLAARARQRRLLSLLVTYCRW